MATARGTQNEFLKKAQKFFNATSGLGRIQKIMVLTDGCDMGKKFCALYPYSGEHNYTQKSITNAHIKGATFNMALVQRQHYEYIMRVSTEGQAIWQLDWWHLFNSIHKGCKCDKDLEKEVCELVRVEKIDGALALLQAYCEAMKCMEKELEKTIINEVNRSTPHIVTPKAFWSTRQREQLEKCITYLTNNKEGIYGVRAYVKKIPAEFLAFGTGPVERLQAVMIAYRMKKQGKHWSVNGADNLIQLLSREWNGEDLERIIEESIEGLSEWEELCSSQVPETHEGTLSSKTQKKKPKPHMDFSPLPVSCLPLLQRGKTDSFFVPLY